MTIRDQVRLLTQDLASLEEERVKRATERAKYLIEKSTTTHRRPERAAEFYREILGAEDAALVLTEEEIDTLVDALIPLLEASPAHAATAAFSLASSQRIYVLPELARAIYRWAPVDPWATRQAIIAVEDIVLSAMAPSTALSTSENASIEEACRALSFAERVAAGGPTRAREAAQGASATIASHLHRRC